MKNIPVILIGCGGVGRQLLQHIVSNRQLHADKVDDVFGTNKNSKIDYNFGTERVQYRSVLEGIHLRVVGVCDSNLFLVTLDVFSTEFDDTFLMDICQIKSDKLPLEKCINSGKCEAFPYSESTRKLTEIASRLGFVLVDCSASSETVEVINRTLNLGCCAVLANKKPLTCSLEDFDKLFVKPRRFRHESTVGAGLPIIAALNRNILSGDEVNVIVGSLSGTLGYIMSEVENGKPFSEAVLTAKELGYTEPDPRDDLSGMDVARKALILARLLGARIDLNSIPVESLYPDKMGKDKMSLEDFLEYGLSELDEDLDKRMKYAISNGKVLRYVCIVQGSRCSVQIQECVKETALGSLKGSDNVVEIYTRCYSRPLVIQGAGAGNDTTATGVLADILDLQDLY